MENSGKNVLAGAHKKFYRIQHPEIYLLDLKVQYKHEIKLPSDMVSKHVFLYLCLPDYKIITITGSDEKRNVIYEAELAKLIDIVVFNICQLLACHEQVLSCLFTSPLFITVA